jgi:hypothetical protein
VEKPAMSTLKLQAGAADRGYRPLIETLKA